MQKLLFPQKYFNVTQGSYGPYSHKSLPAIDIAGKDTSAGDVFSPGEGIIRAIETKYDAYTTVEYKDVVTPLGERGDYNLLFYHNRAFDKYKRGDWLNTEEVFMTEGTNSEPGGFASGNHVHLETRIASSFKKIKPEDVLFLKRGLHTYKANESDFLFYWLADEQDTTVNQIQVTAHSYRIRTEPNGKILGYAELGYWTVLEEKIVDDMTWVRVYKDMWIGVTSSVIYHEGVKVKPIELLAYLDEDYDVLEFIGGRKGTYLYIQYPDDE